ncbi:MAG TPA: DUF3662 and FHA domain-containing protein [Solirubrobacteraceae bacterium]|jgi:hypothetical protein
MNPLRTLENMIAGLVEGTFGRVFKAEVRPMELAHKLAREMDENTTASVSRVYAPNEYSVWLSPRDRVRYEGVEGEVIDELCAYLLEHARAENLALASRPQIVFHTDEALQLGEFGIEARTTRLREEQADAAHDEPRPSRMEARARTPAVPPPPAEEEGGNTMIFSNSERVGGAVASVGGRRRPKALLVVAGRRLLVPPRGATIGRSRDCDIVLDDAGVSRRHAELRPESATTWAIEDLGSTNGVRVNGFVVAGAHELRTGDRIGMGSTEMTFEVAP